MHSNHISLESIQIYSLLRIAIYVQALEELYAYVTSLVKSGLTA